MSTLSDDYNYTYVEWIELSMEYDRVFGYGNQVSLDYLPNAYAENDELMADLYRECIKTGQTIREYLKLPPPPYDPDDPDKIYD